MFAPLVEVESRSRTKSWRLSSRREECSTKLRTLLLLLAKSSSLREVREKMMKEKERRTTTRRLARSRRCCRMTNCLDPRNCQCCLRRHSISVEREIVQHFARSETRERERRLDSSQPVGLRVLALMYHWCLRVTETRGEGGEKVCCCPACPRGERFLPRGSTRRCARRGDWTKVLVPVQCVCVCVVVQQNQAQEKKERVVQVGLDSNLSSAPTTHQCRKYR